MQNIPLSITLSYPDGVSLSFDGQGAVLFASASENSRSFAAAGRLTLGDAAQLMNELMDSFGEETVWLALSLALVSRRINTETGGESSPH